MTSGIDLAFAFIHSQAGQEMAGLIQLTLEYFPSQVRLSLLGSHSEHLCLQANYARKEQVGELPPFCAYEGIGKGGPGSDLPPYIVENYFENQ